ncbi:hypothetical protein N9878_00365 [bacterium]|nr:hypothetical protein [bacterium]
MTLQQLITNIETNLGDRATGVIGNTPVASVILQAVNLSVPQCVKLANPENYDRTLKMTLNAAGGREYDIPTVDGNRIKDITHIRASRSDGTSLGISKVTFSQFVSMTLDYDQELEGVPSLLAFREGKVIINRIPTETYNLTLFVEVYPIDLTNLDLEVALPIDPEWYLAVEAYATWYCYQKLQQANMAQYWLKTYEDQKNQNNQMVRKKDIRGQGMGGAGSAGNWHLNPFIRSNRTFQ